MRQLMSMLMEIACVNRPEKEVIYREAYPLIDNSLSMLIDPVNQGSTSLSTFQEVMTSADFQYALGEYVNRAMWPAYTRQAFAFEPIIFNDVVPNFMDVTRYQRQAGLDDLEMVREKATAKSGYLMDAYRRQYRVYRWEKEFDFSYEAIVNDDLGYFSEMAALMGEAARRTLEKFVSRLYFNTTAIASLGTLGALYAGTARLSTNALMVAWHAYNQRLDARSEPINVRPAYLVIHRGLELTAQQILRSTLVAENATNALNVLPPFTPIVDPYLTGTAPDLPWYLFNTPGAGARTITLARMTGRPGPMVLQKQPDTMAFAGFNNVGPIIPGLGDFESGNILLKVADVWGGWKDATYTGITDYRGIYYSAGTTA